MVDSPPHRIELSCEYGYLRWGFIRARSRSSRRPCGAGIGSIPQPHEVTQWTPGWFSLLSSLGRRLAGPGEIVLAHKVRGVSVAVEAGGTRLLRL